jgi:tetratricopeptide (TPR) repeat protein
MRYLCIFLLTIYAVSSSLLGQESSEQQLGHMSALEQQGRYREVIQPASHLIGSNTLSENELGRAQLILGIAYHQYGDFTHAQNAYEKAVHALSGNQADAADYAAALDNFARLYLDMGHPEIAVSMEKDVLSVCKKLHDHAAIARSYATLANLELNRGNLRKGKEYLSRAMQEAKLTTTLDGDFYAAASSTQGWIAQLDNDISTAISEYARAVELLTAQHGDRHQLTGWGYMLLGRSCAQAGQSATALANMRKGLSILTETTSATDPKYLAAELAYSQVLDQTGDHVEAALIKNTVSQELTDLRSNKCANCVISVAALH